MADQNHWELGNAELTFEPPDVLHIRLGSGITADVIRKEAEVMAKVSAGGRRLILLVDMSRAELLPDARREASKAFKQEWIAATILVGCGVAQRLVIKSIQLAMTVFGSDQLQGIEFVSTEEEGRRRIAELRRRTKAA